ncbi:MAG: hypothetical protein RL386_2168 [Bacteroidota bacterium]|jgi:DNA-binding CsgD family transcriptional regulator
MAFLFLIHQSIWLPRWRATLSDLSSRYWFLMAFGAMPLAAYAQGAPFSINYSKNDYKGGTQNWDIRQDSSGMLYVANNNGLMTFDGNYWNITPVANKTILRSIACTNTGKVWAGAQGELGYFRPAEDGTMQYVSLCHLLPASAKILTDIWNIEITPGGAVLFQAENMLLVWQKNTFQAHFPASQFLFLGEVKDRILLQDREKGLVEFVQDNTLKPLCKLPGDIGVISAILPWAGDTLLLTTQKGHIWALAGNRTLIPWKTPADRFLDENRIYTATLLHDGKLALGTSQGGILILDRQGQQFLINKFNGLQNNSILSLFTDYQGNLWAGTDNGIGYVMVNSPFSYLFPDGQLEGAAYCAQIDTTRVYFGTNNGLYTAEYPSGGYLANAGFKRVENTQGQIWGLYRMDGQLFMGHHEGPFKIETTQKTTPIGNYSGAWTFVAPEGRQDILLGGGYHGLYLFRKSGNNWQLIKKYPGLNESCRIMAMENSRMLWVAHPYRGVYRIIFSEDFLDAVISFFNAKNGLPSDNFNHVFKIGQEVAFTTESGIFRYDHLRETFEIYPLLNDLFPPPTRVRYLCEGRNREIWFAADSDVGYLEPKLRSASRSYQKRTIPFLKDKLLAGFELIMPFNQHQVLFGTDKGFIFFDRKNRRKPPGSILIREVALSGPNIQLLPAKGPTAIPYHKRNNLKFRFSFPWYGGHDGLQYAWKLTGFDTDWSDWTEKPEKEYASLPPGKYEFQVKAGLLNNLEIRPTIYRFEILPPWYASHLAILAYSLTLASLLVLLVVAPRKKIAKERDEHRKIEEAQRRHTEAAQQELHKIRQEKLQAEIAHKNKELGATTLHLLQKGEILNKIREDLQHVAEACEEPHTRKALQKLARVLAEDAQLDADWEQFAIHFDQVHSDFLRRLRERYPQLTPRDQKLCAYLRMNLSSKEIAPLLNISLRGVEISRYRLRRKLQMEAEANLTEFLLNF